jgi:hypothetical protein
MEACVQEHQAKLQTLKLKGAQQQAEETRWKQLQQDGQVGTTDHYVTSCNQSQQYCMSSSKGALVEAGTTRWGRSLQQ